MKSIAFEILARTACLVVLLYLLWHAFWHERETWPRHILPLLANLSAFVRLWSKRRDAKDA
jgi:hypothetical protein